MNKLASVFIPHKGNNYRPHAIRRHGLAIFGVFILIFQGIYNYQIGGEYKILGYATDVSSSALLSATNAQRSASGRSAYSVSTRLTQAAQAKANHMIAHDYWSHYAPDGTSPWYFIEQSGYSYERAGENLAYGFSTSDGVVSGWMNSPSHKANIVDSGFTHVGFGIANGSNFQGDKNTVIVAMYGEPVVAAAPKPKPVATAPQTSTRPSETPQPASREESTPEEEIVEPATPLKTDVESRDVPTIAETTVEEPEVNSQRLLARLADDGEIVVTGNIDTEGIQSDGEITNFDAMISGDAHWSFYMVMGGMLAMAFIFFMRHLQAVYQVIRFGEHFVTGHPTLEASIVYVAIWIMMFATFGAIQ